MPTTYTEGISDAYKMTQESLALLKASIYMLFESSGNNGLTSAHIGKILGIYHAKARQNMRLS